MKTKLLLFFIVRIVISFQSIDAANIGKSTTKTFSLMSNRIASSNISNTQNRASIGKIITNRIGADGITFEQQCQCVLFYLCDKDNVIDLPSNRSDKLQCEELQVCCRLLYNYTESSNSEINLTITNFPETSSQTPETKNNNNSCTCISIDQCSNISDSSITGAGLIDIRQGQCRPTEICCPSVGNNSSSITPGTSWFNTSLDLPVSTSSTVPQISQQCGIRGSRIVNRIVADENEKNTSFGEFPWMSLILKTDIDQNNTKIENVFVCGASLLSANIVLTAAHCVQNLTVNLLKVRVGEYDTQITTEPLPYQDRQVSEIRIHPNFSSRALFNDLALLVTTDPFTFAENVAPICTPFLNSVYGVSDVYDSSRCIATGWGKMSFDNNVLYQSTLKKVNLALVTREDCEIQLRQTRLGKYFVLDPSFICAGGQQNRDTCQGDGGGPLICALRNDLNRYVQVGVISWGIGCGDQIPAAYASLEYNSNWLTLQYNLQSVFSTAL